MWHCNSLQIGERAVNNEWGFSSTGVSRSPTPEPAADVDGEIAKAEEAEDEEEVEEVEEVFEALEAVEAEEMAAVKKVVDGGERD
jgi:hypothetical protein